MINERFDKAMQSVAHERMMDSMLKDMHSRVEKNRGLGIGAHAANVEREYNVGMSSREIKQAYIDRYGADESIVARVASKIFLNEEVDICDVLSPNHMKAFEKFVDRLFEKYKIDFNFTKHFADRMGDDRNKPCIKLKELADFIRKIYVKQGRSLKTVKDAEAVIKDMQSDLNIPIAVKYDSRDDQFDVVLKTIMRKKNFKTPNKIIRY